MEGIAVCDLGMAINWTCLSANTVANYFLDRGWQEGVSIDPLKLQKFVYLAHGWSLFFLKRPLIREPFEAWNYGPIVPSLYSVFQEFGASPIDKPAPIERTESHHGLDEQTKSLLDSVWQTYKSASQIDLSMLTHQPGYAWDLTRRSGYAPAWGGPKIPNDWIADEFTRRKQQADQQAIEKQPARAG